MDRLKLDGWCEKAIVGLVVVIIGFSALATGAVGPQEFSVVQWLTVLLLVLWLCRFWLNPKHRLLWSPLCWAMLAFMAYAVIRYLSADVEYLARQEMIKVLIYGFLLFAVITNLHRLETTQLIAIIVIGLGAFISLYAIYQFLSGSDHVWNFVRAEGYGRRGSGSFLSPNSCAAYLGMIFPLGLAYTMTGRLGHLQRVFYGYATLLIFCGIVATVSRGGWLAAIAAILIFFVVLLRQRDYRLHVLLMAGALILLGAGALSIAKLSENRRKTLANLPSDPVRLHLWEPAWAMFKDHPVVGIGPDHFDVRFRQYRPATPHNLQFRPGRVHNDYLNTLVDWGIIGFVLIGSVWGIFYWEVFRSWKYVQRQQNDLAAKRSNKSAFVLGGSLGLFALLMHSFVDFNFHIPAVALLATTLLGLVAGHFRFATEGYWFTVRWPLKIAVNVVLIAALTYLIPQTARHTAESNTLARADEEFNNITNRLDALKQAFAIDPKNFETPYDIGETLRLVSWEGAPDFRKTANEAMEWFQKAIKLNAYDPYPYMRYGMCLDWIGRHTDAEPYFKKALDLDPNGYYVVAHQGWHAFQVGDYVMAKRWFERSLNLYNVDNPIARAYLQILQQKSTETTKN